MDNKHLDKYFKDLLSNLDGGHPMDTWDMLSDKLDANLTPDSTDDLAFDESVKNSLGNLVVTEIPAWDSFLSSLELDESLVDIQSDITLDDTVKDSLQDLEAEYDPNTWDTLSNKLDVQDSLVQKDSDAAIDQLAYDKLLNYTVPQRAGEWEVFNKELDKEFILPYKLLFKYKLAEVAILASLILIFFQAKPILENHIQHNKAISVEQQQESIAQLNDSEQSSAIVDVNNTAQNIKIAKDKSSSLPLTKKANRSVQTYNTDAITKTSISKSSKLGTLEAKSSSIEEAKHLSSNINNSAQNSISRKINEVSIKVPQIIIPVIKGENIQSTREQNGPSLITTNNDIDKGIGTILDVTKLPLEAMVTLSFDDEKGLPYCKACQKLNTLPKWRLGVHLDADFNYIMTSYDKIFDLNSYNHATWGYGAGLSTSLLIGNWELESGFSYATKQYAPKSKLEYLGNLSQGYLKVNLNKIQMNTLSVPLNLRHHFNKNSVKTHLYVHGGATMHVATQANYFIKSEFLGTSRRPGLTETNDLIKSSDTSADKIYSLGWFEGGSYIENSYFTANLGLGFEQRVSTRYSIFGQATYSQYLNRNGLGPNNDRFNTLNLSTGVRAIFK